MASNKKKEPYPVSAFDKLRKDVARLEEGKITTLKSYKLEIYPDALRQALKPFGLQVYVDPKVKHDDGDVKEYHLIISDKVLSVEELETKSRQLDCEGIWERVDNEAD